MLFHDVMQQFHPQQADTIDFKVPELWGQGRSVFGGMSAALAFAHLQTAMSAEMPLRSLMISFVAPLNDGSATAQRRILRHGKSVVQASVELHQHDQVALVLLASYGQSRQSAISIGGAPRPKLAAPEQGKFLPKQGPVPEFTRFFDYSIVTGGIPFTNTQERQMAGYMRFSNAPTAPVGYLELLALIDSWPPASLQLLSKPSPASSLTWTIEFIPTTEQGYTDQWWLYQADIEYAADGYSHIASKCWNPAGELTVISRQVTTVFG